MLNRFYLENYLSFENVDLEFKKGLIVFSGPSGAGKSILMNSILSLFSNNDAKASLSEASIQNENLQNENYNINNSDFVIKQITSSKTRYLLNNQAISKKELNLFSMQFFRHLHLKDTSDFDSSNIIEFLDFLSIKNDSSYEEIINDFKFTFTKLQTLNQKYKKLINEEQNIEDLKELCTLQIQKINDINPIDGEYEELKDLKDILNQKDKIDNALSEVKPFLDNSHAVSKALSLLNIDTSFFDQTINEVNIHFQDFYDKVDSIEDVDIEQTLDRIENLSKLIKKHGSIQEVLAYKKEKENELDSYENITFEKEIIKKNISELQSNIINKSNIISQYRKKTLEILKKDMNTYLEYLYLDNLNIKIIKKDLDKNGEDEIVFELNKINLNKISSGEFNRLRLALLTARSMYEVSINGILFLDEIDANLSGKESESIAKVLSILAKNYQIFAISHQPQLSSTAQQHFYVSKTNNISVVTLLDDEQRISEVARMISGENITNEAKLFAQQLLKRK